MSEKEYLYWLCHIPGLGAVSIRRLYEYFGSFRAIWNAGKNEIAACKVLKAQQQEAFLENRKKTDDLQREYDGLAARGIRFLAMTDQEYPQRLRPFHDSPAGLFVKGRLPEEERPDMKQLFDELAARVTQFQSVTESSRTIMEVNLHAINQMVARQGGGRSTYKEDGSVETGPSHFTDRRI